MDCVLRGSPLSAAHVLSREQAVHHNCEADSPGDDCIQDLSDSIEKSYGSVCFWLCVVALTWLPEYHGTAVLEGLWVVSRR